LGSAKEKKGKQHFLHVDAANPFSYLCLVFDYMHEGILAGPVQSIDV
jgi:hypothetical protein